MFNRFSKTFTALLLISLQSLAGAADQQTFFEMRIRPLLSEKCYGCHGPEKQKSELRLDHIQFILKGGETGPALLLENLEGSRLLSAIGYEDVDLQMPPKGKLSDGQIADLTRWISEGAYWPDEPEPGATPSDKTVFDLEGRAKAHWAWQPVNPVAPPTVEGLGPEAHPIDRILHARLESEGLQTAPRTEKNVLLRRLSFDLTGLPPAPEDFVRFAANHSPEAYASEVDRLLASPAFGERWARHWMDLTRFSETYGHEQDYPILYAWRYRDYLIRAFNDDLPYDQLIREHVAGDLLETPRQNPEDGTNESIKATAFWFMYQATHGPVDPVLDRADRIDNQIDVLGKAFLGVTLACARCHEHKFDAISIDDYYAIAGFLRSSRRDFSYLDPRGEIHAHTERQRGIHSIANRKVSQHLAELSKSDDLNMASNLVDALKQEELDQSQNFAGNRAQRSARLEHWRAALRDPVLEDPAHPAHPWRIAGDSRSGREVGEIYEDFNSDTHRAWFASGEAFADFKDTGLRWSASDTLALTPPGVVDSGHISRGLQGTLRSPTFTITRKNIHVLAAGEKAHFRVIVEDFLLAEYNRLLFENTVHEVNTNGDFKWFSVTHSLRKYIGMEAYLEFEDSGDGYIAIDEIRFSDEDVLPPVSVSKSTPSTADALKLEDAARIALRDINSGSISKTQGDLLHWIIKHRLIPLDKIEVAMARYVNDIKALQESAPQPIRALTITDGTPSNAHVYLRGNPRTPGKIEPRRFLAALGGKEDPPITEGSGRLALANRIADPANPLTARVMVNRIWYHLMGSGIVPTPDNFGVLGQAPTHPELLDYLAERFVRDGWSVKRLIRHIVMSEAYGMSSAPVDQLAEQKDPSNVLFHRANLRRLESEAIRDTVLAVAGTLDPTMYGPSVPIYLSPFMGGHRRPGKSGPMDGDRRRSLYVEIRRNYLSPMMLAFDMPLPDSTIGRRTVSNVPAQALIMMNDPFVAEQAQKWGEQLTDETLGAPSDRVETMYLSALGRSPRSDERDRMTSFMAEQAAAYELDPQDAATDPRVWRDLCHVLFTLKEFIYLQ